MRLKFLPVIAVLALVGCNQTSVSTGYYEIEGKTAKSLDRDIRRKGPMKGHALASAAIKFEPLSIQERETDKGCDIKSAKIKVIAKITLPRWVNRTGPALTQSLNVASMGYRVTQRPTSKRMSKSLMPMPARWSERWLQLSLKSHARFFRKELMV